ncbi:hypothetical protein Tco_0408606, partial [Tanacetum coccineum]
SAKKQQSVAMSSAEAEYVAAVGCYASILWMKSQLTDYDIIYEKVSTPTGGIRGDIGINTFRNALRAHYLPYSSMYVSPPSITIVRPWFATIGYSGKIGAKGTLKKSFLLPRWRLLIEQIIECLRVKTSGLDQISNKDATILYCLANGVKVDYAKLIWEDIIYKLNKKSREKVFSVQNWALKPNQTEGPPFTDHMKAICNLDVHVDSKAPKPSSQTEEVPQGKRPRAKSGLRRKQYSKHTSESKTEASKSKTGQSKKKTQSSSSKDTSPSHHSPPTLVVAEMHKEAQQAAGGPTSLGATSEEGSHSQLSSGCDALANSIAEADPGISTPNDSIPLQQGMDKGTKNYSIDHIFARTNPNVLVDQTKSAGDGLKTAHTNSGTYKESKADELSKKIKLEDLSDLIKDTRSAFFTPDFSQDEPIIVLDESEEETEKDEDTHTTSHDVPEDTLFPHPPSPKLAQIQELMAQIHLLQTQKNKLEQQKATTEAEPELSKLLASHNFASCLPTGLKELSSKFTELFGEIKELKKHVKDMEIELHGDLKVIPTKLETFTSTISSLTSEKNTTKDTKTNLQNELVDLLGIDVVEQYHNKKLLFDKYYDKMLKRRKSSKIINCDILTQKGLISLKVYREDGRIEVIANFKVSDLHLAEWREVIQACPDRKEKGWKTIYGLIKTRMEYLDQTEKELKIDFYKPLKEQDPLNELNELANKKRKRTSDLKDHFRSTKKHKSSSST